MRAETRSGRGPSDVRQPAAERIACCRCAGNVGSIGQYGNLVIPPPDSPDVNEIVVRYAARCATREDAFKVWHETVPLANGGPAGIAGIGTRPPVKELYGIWPCLIPRELVRIGVDYLES